MPAACPWDGYVRHYVSEAIVPPSPPASGGAAAARRREKEGGAAVCSDKREAPTGKPWASRTCQCPRLDRGIITLAATSARQSYPSPPGSGGAAAARRREREGGAAVCSDKREAPTGKPWASRPCQCPRLAVGTVTFAATRAVVRPAPKCPRLARGIVTLAATSARQSYIHLRRAAAEPPLPGGKKRKGRRPVVAANVRLPRASRGHPGPANAHGLTVGLLRSPLSPRSPASLPNAHGLPVGWLRSPLRQRGNCTPISAGQRRSRRCPAERKRRGCRRV
jgi:hypothetical protein